MNPGKCLRSLLPIALSAVAVLALPAMAAAKDHNHDRIPDRWEKRHHLSLTVNQSRRDQDSDHLRNRAEFLAGDNPRDEDSDDDGVEDGEENAGTIQSFDPATGRLVIALFGGETASGLVTEETEIRCEGEHSASASDSGEDEAADDSGDSEEPGDDGEELGDDHDGEGGETDDDHGEPSSGPGEGDGGACGTADLTEGAVVRQAELGLENGAATFDEIELAG